ncbi:hypothetical protein Nepgr_022448 [Nepenthes gracilis]|uniref:RING-type domain-containing protein n=1 Tax=Nepenthes gracilis TaxID=150966 RepID=A0AAD3XWT6_NEPGR|nr:hypothetical protein Nepgr_022448 [Nepenthes gracilis]
MSEDDSLRNLAFLEHETITDAFSDLVTDIISYAVFRFDSQFFGPRVEPECCIDDLLSSRCIFLVPSSHFTMNGNQQTELQYIYTGYPYTVTESFMSFFDQHAPEHYIYPGPIHDQGSAYWSMNMNSYRFELYEPGSTSYNGSFEVDDCIPTAEVNTRDWEYPSAMYIDEPVSLDLQCEENAASSPQNSPEEYIVNHTAATDSEVVWQDNIDPDNMTYEELLDLGEAVGTQTRGLSEELIKLLPISRYKAGGFFSRKKIRERCVICLLTYKIGDQQITLPCKHVYHKKCGTKWLNINKACPVCNGEVFGSEPRH